MVGPYRVKRLLLSNRSVDLHYYFFSRIFMKIKRKSSLSLLFSLRPPIFLQSTHLSVGGQLLYVGGLFSKSSLFSNRDEIIR